MTWVRLYAFADEGGPGGPWQWVLWAEDGRQCYVYRLDAPAPERDNAAWMAEADRDWSASDRPGWTLFFGPRLHHEVAAREFRHCVSAPAEEWWSPPPGNSQASS